MLLLAADENFDNDIVRGVLRRNPRVDIVRIQEVGLSGAGDQAVLEWAAGEGRILLTHDASTLTRYAYDRVNARLAMPGVFEVSCAVPVGTAIEDILVLWRNSAFLENGKAKSGTCRCNSFTRHAMVRATRTCGRPGRSFSVDGGSSGCRARPSSAPAS